MTLEEKRQRLFKDLAGISMLCELINIYYLNSVKGTRFRNPKIQDKADKIAKFAQSIQSKELAGVVRLKSETKDLMENEHALQLWRIVDHFMFMPTEHLEQFADGLEQMVSNG